MLSPHLARKRVKMKKNTTTVWLLHFLMVGISIQISWVIKFGTCEKSFRKKQKVILETANSGKLESTDEATPLPARVFLIACQHVDVHCWMQLFGICYLKIFCYFWSGDFLFTSCANRNQNYEILCPSPKIQSVKRSTCSVAPPRCAYLHGR